MNNYRAWSLFQVVQKKNRWQKSRTSYTETAGIVFTARYYENNSEIILKGYNYSCLHLWFENVEMLLFLRHAVETSTLYFRSYNVILPKFSSLCKCLSYSSAVSSKYQPWVWYLVFERFLNVVRLITDIDSEELNRNDIPWFSAVRHDTVYFLGYLHFTFSRDKPWTFWGLELKVGISLVLSVVCFITYNVLLFN